MWQFENLKMNACKPEAAVQQPQRGEMLVEKKTN